MENLLCVGKKNGELDFCIPASISELSYEQMNEFRAMVMVAIGTAEHMWRQGNEGAHTVQGASKDGVIYSW